MCSSSMFLHRRTVSPPPCTMSSLTSLPPSLSFLSPHHHHFAVLFSFLSSDDFEHPCQIHETLKKVVQMDNLELHRYRSHYTSAYFLFIRRLLMTNKNHIKSTCGQNPLPAIRVGFFLHIKIVYKSPPFPFLPLSMCP